MSMPMDLYALSHDDDQVRRTFSCLGNWTRCYKNERTPFTLHFHFIPLHSHSIAFAASILRFCASYTQITSSHHHHHKQQQPNCRPEQYASDRIKRFARFHLFQNTICIFFLSLQTNKKTFHVADAICVCHCIALSAYKRLPREQV